MGSATVDAYNAEQLYQKMDEAIDRGGYRRQVNDPESPSKFATEEAEPGQTFTLMKPWNNVVACDYRWAVANALHFFADTQAAMVLLRYNQHADRFVKDGIWLGSYGAIAMPQVRECIKLLREHPDSRRAIVSMGGPTPRDINRPACWNTLHFLMWKGALDLMVYQRSLNLPRVMPYDCVVLTNALLHVAKEIGRAPGSLRWTVGSLHRQVGKEVMRPWRRVDSIVLPHDLMRDPAAAYKALEEGYPDAFAATEPAG